MKKLLLSLLLLSLTASADFKVPELLNPVNDYTGTLTAQGKEAAAKKIVEMKKETGVQLGVLLVDTLDGTDIESASLAVADKWKLGKKGENRGVLLMIALKDRKSRIEVGYGLEPILTDATIKDILVSMRPYLRSKDYDQAILSGVDNIYSTVRNYKEAPTPTATPKTEEDNSTVYVLTGLGVLGAILALFALVGRKKKPTRTTRETVTRKSSYTPPVRSSRSSEKSSRSETAYVPVPTRSRRDDDDDSSSRSSWGSSSSSSDDSSSGSSWDGGGGDFGGGGSSDSW